MAIVINGSGTVTGLAVGGLPDDTVDEGSLANSINTSIGAKLPLAGGTVTGNVIHNDNVKALFGTGNDLEIYHDGSDSIIRDAGTGALEIRSNELKIKNAAGNENAVYFAEDGAVNLYHNNALKLATTAAGGTLSGYWTGATKVKHINTSRNMTTASGTQAITGVGFTPLAVIANAMTEGTSGASWGTQAGTVKGATADYTAGSTGANNYTNGSASYVINLVTTGGAHNQKATVSSWDADGATLTWTKAGTPTGTAYIRLLFIG